MVNVGITLLVTCLPCITSSPQPQLYSCTYVILSYMMRVVGLNTSVFPIFVELLRYAESHLSCSLALTVPSRVLSSSYRL